MATNRTPRIDFRVAVDNFSDASHRLIDRQSEFGYGRQQVKDQHIKMTRECVERQLGDQSRVETIIEPQRLMAFSS
ncbi:MAG: hypothetical protein KY455_01330 [Euryarchaeota archaeon]|nr:hypothetical protein [Euryarchaeota archaeon]